MARPWETIDTQRTTDGLLELQQRNQTDFLITIDSRVLMNSHGSRSEKLLSILACNKIKNRQNPKILIGGLGMGCTLRAALDELPEQAEVLVAELNQIILRWCRGPLSDLTHGAVDDARVSVKITDVATIIQDTAENKDKNSFDAIILDLYEGPFEAARERYDHVYGKKALETARSALTPGGILAVWSEDPDKAFEKRLSKAGFSFRRHIPPKGSKHVVYIAEKTAGPHYS